MKKILISTFFFISLIIYNYGVTSTLGGDGVITLPTKPILLAISGFEPDKYSTNQLLINPGECTSANSNSSAQLNSILTLDMTKNGLNGLDAGSPQSGVGYFVYVVKNESTGQVGAVISASIFYSGVKVPAGFTLYRKLRFGFIYNKSRDGIPDFHLSAWPMPIIRLTGSETSPAYNVLNNGASTVFSDISLAEFIPDNARMAYVQCITTAVGNAGTAYLRSFDGQPTGVVVGSATPGGMSDSFSITMRVTSDIKLQYKVIGGARLSIYVLGYEITEPS